MFSTAYIPHIPPPSTSSNGDPKYVGFFCAFCRFVFVCIFYLFFLEFHAYSVFFRALIVRCLCNKSEKKKTLNVTKINIHKLLTICRDGYRTHWWLNNVIHSNAGGQCYYENMMMKMFMLHELLSLMLCKHISVVLFSVKNKFWCLWQRQKIKRWDHVLVTRNSILIFPTFPRIYSHIHCFLPSRALFSSFLHFSAALNASHTRCLEK